MGNNDWQGKLRSKMETFSEPLPDSVWDAVESGVGAAWDRRRRMRRRRRMFAGAATVFAAAALASVVMFRGDEDRVMLMPAASRQVLAAAPVLQEELFLPSAAALPPDPERSLGNHAGTEPLQYPEAVLPAPAPSDAAAVTEQPEGNPGQEPGAEEPEESLPVEDDMAAFPQLFDAGDDDEGGGIRIRLGLKASNLAPGSNEALGYGGMYGAAVMPAPTAQRDQLVGYSSVLLNNNSQEVSTHTEHWQPVSVGVSLSLGFGERFSLDGGLDYSCLVSDMSSGTADNRYDIRQTLHYVGLPLRARFSFWKPAGFDFYLTAGGKVEKCVGGTTSTYYIVDSAVKSTVRDRIIVEPLQWSVGASFGLGYSFNEFLGIYAEPGFSYYFDNGSFVETVYRERPFNFSLSLGLRFSLN